jgi:hypothetical protein
MNVSFYCPQCEHLAQLPIAPGDRNYRCPNCQKTVTLPEDTFVDGKLARCIACPSHDLFVRKDFSQRLGVTIVTIGAIASSIPWYYGYPLWTFAILFACAGIDLVLYLFMPECLMCYRCGAIYRDVPDMNEREHFDLETHEKHRQQKIRLAEAQAAAAAQQPKPAP